MEGSRFETQGQSPEMIEQDVANTRLLDRLPDGLKRPVAIAGIALAGVGAGSLAAANKVGESDVPVFGAEPAIAQTEGDAEIAALEQSCTDEALRRPSFIREKYYGNPKKGKVKWIVEVPDMSEECDGIVSRYIEMRGRARRYGIWVDLGINSRSFRTNDDTRLVAKTKVKKYCNYSPSKTRGDKLNKGDDSRLKTKSQLRVGLFAELSNGKGEGVWYEGKMRRICRKKG